MQNDCMHFRDAVGHEFHILTEENFWFLYEPLSKLLPDMVNGSEIQDELSILQTKFSEAVSAQLTNTTGDSTDGDYAFPGHFQKLRLMYVYAQSDRFFSSQTAEALVTSLRPFGNAWFAETEYECLEDSDLCENFFCHSGCFYFELSIGNHFAHRMAVEPISKIEWQPEPLDFPTV